MKKNSYAIGIIRHCLIVFWVFSAATVNAAVVNVTWTEDIDQFNSSWVITDNGGGDFTGSDSVAGTYWQVALSMDGFSVLQDSVGHVVGSHGEDFISSSFDYGVMPTTYFEETSFVQHDNGHRDEFTLTSDYVAGEYQVSIIGKHSVPIPASIWLFSSGLGLMGWLRKRSKK